jgi:hypothetical protein
LKSIDSMRYSADSVQMATHAFAHDHMEGILVLWLMKRMAS